MCILRKFHKSMMNDDILKYFPNSTNMLHVHLQTKGKVNCATCEVRSD